MSLRRIFSIAFLVVFAGVFAMAETCLTTGDMDPATKNAIESAARQYYGYTAAGDVSSLRSNAIPSLAGNFGGIERTVVNNKDAFSGSQPNVYSTYILDATGGPATLDNALFVCGVYNSNDRIQFSIPGLPAAKYAMVVMEANGPKGPYWLSLILQQMGPSWKLAGFYPRQRRVNDKGAGWFLTQARDYRAKGEMHNAYFYYVTARQLALPVSFMLTRPVEKLDGEAQPIVPKDLPGDNPMNFSTGSGSYQVTEMTPIPSKDGVHLVIKYKALGDISDTRTRFANNLDIIKGMAQKYPEYRNAFSAYEAWAIDPQTGRDYETTLNMADVK